MTETITVTGLPKSSEKSEVSAWVALMPKDHAKKQGVQMVYERTSDINKIADAVDVVFADSRDEAAQQIRAGLMEDPDSPFTQISPEGYRHHITVMETPALNPEVPFSMEYLAQYVKDNGGEVEIRGILTKFGSYYCNDSQWDLREQFWAAGLTIDFNHYDHQVVRYDPKKAKRQWYSHRRYRKGYNPPETVKMATKGDIDAACYRMETAIRHSIGGRYTYVDLRIDYRERGCAVSGKRLMVVADFFNGMFGKNAHRKLDRFQELISLWKTTKQGARNKYTPEFCVWMDAEGRARKPKKLFDGSGLDPWKHSTLSVAKREMQALARHQVEEAEMLEELEYITAHRKQMQRLVENQ